MNKYIRSSRPYFPREDIGSIIKDIDIALDEGRLRNGDNLRTFERNFAEYIGTNNAVAFDSDSSAFEVTLRNFKVENKEVIVCTNSFISVPNSVLFTGGRVVFADIGEETLSMDPNNLEQNISEKTRGVIITHIAGFPNPYLRDIIEICKKRDLFLIEDATHAVGATIDGKKVGTFGDAAIFAFTPTKVLTTGEGGMMVTNDPKLSEKARRLRFYGSGPGKMNFVNLGRHMVLPEISAILGIYQLRRLDEFIDKRNRIATIYDTELNKMNFVNIVRCPHGYRSSYYKYPLILSEKIDRGKCVDLLEKEYGIETGNIFYPPCHLQPIYESEVGIHRGSLSISERVLSRTITLPMHIALDDNDARYVTHSVHLAGETSMS